MNLEKHISSLLYHHDCLVVPEFGAFIAQKSNSIYHKETTSFMPPQKQLAFNPSIVKSDGILIQNISQVEGLTFDEAKEQVESCVQLWKNQLESKGKLDLENLGILTKTEQGSIDFIPKHPNFLLDSFGLESIKAEFILPEISTSDQTGSSAVWWKVAAVVPILLGGFLYFGKPRSEERRVGKECRSRWAPCDEKKQVRRWSEQEGGGGRDRDGKDVGCGG